MSLYELMDSGQISLLRISRKGLNAARKNKFPFEKKFCTWSTNVNWRLRGPRNKESLAVSDD